MKIAMGADHAGVVMKDQLADFVRRLGHEVIDVGAHSTDSCDYPLFAQKVCQHILADQAERGILICGSGIGMAIAANRFKGIRAANVGDSYSARMSREHNDSNILTLGARVIGPGLAEEIVETWIQTSFEGGRHQRRLDLLDAFSAETN